MKTLVRLIVAVLLLTVSIRQMQACWMAYQNRMFPIGSCPKGFVVVEMRLSRDEYLDTASKREILGWRGCNYLNVYDRSYKLVSSIVLDTLQFHDKDYDTAIHTAFTHGLYTADSIHGLVLAEPRSLMFYGFRKKGSAWELSYSRQRKDLVVRSGIGKIYAVSVLHDRNSIAGSFISSAKVYGFNFSEMADLLYISSVRSFEIGGKKLTVFHLAKGEFVQEKERKPDLAFNDLKTSTFIEPVAGHEQGFDFFIWE